LRAVPGTARYHTFVRTSASAADPAAAPSTYPAQPSACICAGRQF
jgi:hypothetical protein